MESLTKLSIRTICASVFQWEVQGDKFSETLTLISYFEKLPNDLREEILKFMKLAFREIFYIEARHIALFLYDNMKVLRLNFSNKHFNLRFLLNIAGDKLKNLKEFELPDGCRVSALACKELCKVAPNIKKLYLDFSLVQDKAFMYLAKLPVVQLYIGNLSEEGVKYLCVRPSKLRNTLKVCHVDHMSDRSYYTILKTMRRVENIGNRTSWLFHTQTRRLMQLGLLNLKKLVFDYPNVFIERELGLATIICSKVTEICISTGVFTQKMIWSLTQFKSLSVLGIYVQTELESSENIEIPLANGISMENLLLPNLLDLTLSDEGDKWISTGYFFMILDMCPNIERLTLDQCAGFSNKVAAELTDFMMSRKLRHLVISYCDLLLPTGFEDLLKIPTLQQMKIDLNLTEFNRPYFHLLQDLALKYGSNLHEHPQSNVHVDINLVRTINHEEELVVFFVLLYLLLVYTLCLNVC